MMLLQLSPTQRRGLQQIVKCSHDARQVKRAQALLWLDQGESVDAVAARQGVARQTIYNLVHTFQKRHLEPVVERLRDRSRSGRPPKKRETAQKLIREVMDQDPREWGYHSPTWTVPLLCRHLKREQGIEVSERTIRRALRGLRYRYKRPRHVLARRSLTWRQAKGGYNAG